MGTAGPPLLHLRALVPVSWTKHRPQPVKIGLSAYRQEQLVAYAARRVGETRPSSASRVGSARRSMAAIGQPRASICKIWWTTSLSAKTKSSSKRAQARHSP